jgi:very-short-patch-repair endonuclease
MSTTPVSMTDAENRLWNCLCESDLGSDVFHPQYVVGSYTVDFCAPQHKLIIEVDDPELLEHDEFYVIRNAWLEAAGWRLLRFTSHDTLKNTNGVLSVILAVVRKADKSVLRLAGKSLAEMMDFEI